MAVREITKAEFDQFNPQRHPMIGTVIQEKSWFADEGGLVIGTVTLDSTDQDWGYVVLGPDEGGLFRGIDLAVSLESREVATTSLRACIRKHAESGNTIFGQGE
jgi:hypothetical protein